MNQFIFKGNLKTALIGAIILGVICLGWTWMIDDENHTRFWSNFLHNSVFFTGIAFTAIFFIAVCITAYAGWHTVFKRIWESFAMFLIPGLILMAIIGIGVFMHWHHLYHWADTSLLVEGSENYDRILAGKASFLNKNWYLFGTVIIVGTWAYFAIKLRNLSIQEDEQGDSTFSHHRTMRKYAAIFLPIAGFTSAALVWQWVMSVDAHWYSTLFAWYATASWFVSMIALTILVLIYLKGKGYFPEVQQNHIHDLGKFLFAFSIFWTYLWFSQYMLIWYANVGEETIYFKERYDNYPVLFFGNIVINFAIPFLVLMRNDTKYKLGSVGIIAGIVLIGHWLDFFLMFKPGIAHTAHESHGAVSAAVDHGHEAVAHATEHASSFVSGFTLPGLLELGTFIGFLGLFLFVFFTYLAKSSLSPKNDPYFEESLHHHV
jgi:hypothetical protein